METNILKLLGDPRYLPQNVPGLLRELGLPPGKQQELQRALAGLEKSGQIARIKGNRYIIPVEADLVPGRIRINRAGVGFLQPNDPKLRPITIPSANTATAMNADHVLVRRDPSHRGLRPPGRPAEEFGKVIRILERSRTQLVGTLQRGKEFFYVIPDDPRIPHDIYVPPARDVGRTPNLGDKVVVELKVWESRHTNPEGEIIEVLGSPDAEGVDMLSILRHYQLPLHFPKEVLREAQSFPPEVEERDVAGRIDCRTQSVITIDPDDAKDFDDAICLEPAGPDQWKLWVHIADVSHYVKPGSELDAEARRRGNSTYLVDRVIPMLPEALSNELCSLKPHVNRLTRCVEFLLTSEGRVVRAQFYSAVIRSQRRFTYGEVLTILQRPPVDPIERMVHAAHRMTQRIRRARMQAGSLELDFPENKIRLDEQGRILRIERVENDISHQLVEECMLLANEAVARELQRLQRPAVYRVHEAPDVDRLEEFREEVVAHRIACGNLTHRPEVQKLLAKLHKLPAGDALKIGFLKSLMRARYAVEPLGHYGLAKKHYTHFTSPIRRYADLMVHRSLFGKSSPRPVVGSLKEAAEHISETERNSSDAERDSKQIKLFAHLANQLKTGRLERYPALVIDVRNFGFFVDLPTLGLSGLVHLSMLQEDFYQFDFNRSQLIGRRTRRVIQLGDRVEVEVAKVETYKKQVDFRLAGTAARTGASSPAPERSRDRGRNRRGGQERARGGKQRPALEKSSRPPAQGRPQGGTPPRRNHSRPRPQGQRRRSGGRGRRASA